MVAYLPKRKNVKIHLPAKGIILDFRNNFWNLKSGDTKWHWNVKWEKGQEISFLEKKIKTIVGSNILNGEREM